MNLRERKRKNTPFASQSDYSLWLTHRWWKHLKTLRGGGQQNKLLSVPSKPCTGVNGVQRIGLCCCGAVQLLQSRMTQLYMKMCGTYLFEFKGICLLVLMAKSILLCTLQRDQVPPVLPNIWEQCLRLSRERMRKPIVHYVLVHGFAVQVCHKYLTWGHQPACAGVRWWCWQFTISWITLSTSFRHFCEFASLWVESNCLLIQFWGRSCGGNVRNLRSSQTMTRQWSSEVLWIAIRCLAHLLHNRRADNIMSYLRHRSHGGLQQVMCLGFEWPFEVLWNVYIIRSDALALARVRKCEPYPALINQVLRDFAWSRQRPWVLSAVKTCFRSHILWSPPFSPLVWWYFYIKTYIGNRFHIVVRKPHTVVTFKSWVSWSLCVGVNHLCWYFGDTGPLPGRAVWWCGLWGTWASIEAHFGDRVLEPLDRWARLAADTTEEARPNPLLSYWGKAEFGRGKFLEGSSGNVGIKGVEGIGHRCQHLHLPESTCKTDRKSEKHRSVLRNRDT